MSNGRQLLCQKEVGEMVGKRMGEGEDEWATVNERIVAEGCD